MDWASLERGSARQRAAHAAIRSLGVMEALAGYGPVLCGTIPLGIDLPESDLDIVCEAAEPAAFAARVTALFGGLEGFRTREKVVNGLPTVIVRFRHAGFDFELFGHPRPAREQNAYRHMVAEARLLALAGPEAAEAIRALKAGGLKTEPAFAAYFGLGGDPYAVLLDLAGAPEQALSELVRRDLSGEKE